MSSTAPGNGQTNPSGAVFVEGAFCPRCGYDLRASFGETCPECGGTLDENALRQTQILWLRRREVGRLRALWRTAFFVTFHGQRMSYEMARPVDFSEARRFHRTVAILLWLTPVAFASLFVLAVLFSESWEENAEPFGTLTTLAVLLTAPPALLLFFFTATAVHTYWFHPRHLSTEQQNRTLALSYFACAPLLFLPPAILLGAAGVLLMNLFNHTHTLSGTTWFYVGAGMLIAAAILGLSSIVAFWRVCTSLAGTLAQRGTGGKLLLALSLPWLWALLFALFALGMPLAAGYTALMIQTW